MNSWKIARIAGIDLELHWTTLLFIGLLILLSPITGIVLAILFVIISLHELSHSIVAKHRGIEVKRIILLPIGGMAVMEESTVKPEDEFYMAFAGPAFNFVFAGFILLLVQIFHMPIYSFTTWNAMMDGKIPIRWIGFIVSNLFWLNWLLGTFNLFVPAIPMDGGRVLRAFLAMMMDYVKATKIAGYVSRVITIGMILFSILAFNIILFLIAIFIWVGASAEIEQAIDTRVLTKIDLHRLLKKRVPKVKPGTKVKNVINLMVKRNISQVFVGDRMFVTTQDLKDANPDDTVDKYARPVKPIPMSRPESMLKSFLAQNAEILPVVYGRKVIGYICLEDLSRAIKIAKEIYLKS